MSLPWDWDIVLCFFYFKSKEQERTISLTLILCKKGIRISKKGVEERVQLHSTFPDNHTPYCVLRPLSSDPFRQTVKQGEAEHESRHTCNAQGAERASVVLPLSW